MLAGDGYGARARTYTGIPSMSRALFWAFNMRAGVVYICRLMSCFPTDRQSLSFALAYNAAMEIKSYLMNDFLSLGYAKVAPSLPPASGKEPFSSHGSLM